VRSVTSPGARSRFLTASAGIFARRVGALALAALFACPEPARYRGSIRNGPGAPTLLLPERPSSSIKRLPTFEVEPQETDRRYDTTDESDHANRHPVPVQDLRDEEDRHHHDQRCLELLPRAEVYFPPAPHVRLLPLPKAS
jgi:hypothetical protein